MISLVAIREGLGNRSCWFYRHHVARILLERGAMINYEFERIRESGTGNRALSFPRFKQTEKLRDTVCLKLDGAKEIELLRLVTVGSVDDGKSTLIGRLLVDTKGAFEDQLLAVRKKRARARNCFDSYAEYRQLHPDRYTHPQYRRCRYDCISMTDYPAENKRSFYL